MVLKEQFGNEQKIASAYMDKTLSWPPIRAEDVKALQDYSLFLHGWDVQYLLDSDMPSNVLSVVKKLPSRLRDRLRSHACELQERHNQRAEFTDVADFSPVFGNIQDSPSMTTNKVTASFRK